MCHIDLPLQFQGGNRKTIVIAEIVDVAPHLASVMTFAVHRNVLDSWASDWRVSNVETGMSVREADAMTRKDCIELARQYLSSKRPQECGKMMKRLALKYAKEKP